VIKQFDYASGRVMAVLCPSSASKHRHMQNPISAFDGEAGFFGGLTVHLQPGTAFLRRVAPTKLLLDRIRRVWRFNKKTRPRQR
jgi:hypothetical protein